MTAQNPLKSSFAKIARAETLQESLNQNIAEYFSGKWHDTSFKHDPETGYSLKVEIFGMPKEFTPIVGDIVHNLRSALDLAVVEAVKFNGESTNKVSFPFCESADFYETMLQTRNIRRAGPDVERIIRSLKPYHGGNVVLRGLHDLDIMDKHIELVSTSTSITSPEIGIVMEDDGVTPKGFATGELQIELKSEPVPTIDFVFAEGVPLAGQVVLSALDDMKAAVEGIVSSIQGALIT